MAPLRYAHSNSLRRHWWQWHSLLEYLSLVLYVRNSPLRRFKMTHYIIGPPIASPSAIDEIRSLPATKRGQSFIGSFGGQF